MKVWLVLAGFAALFLFGLVAYNLRTFHTRARGQALAERGVAARATVLDAFESASRYTRGVIEYRYAAPDAAGGTTTYKGKGELPPGSVRHVSAGDVVEIRYLPDDPAVSQLEGNPLPGIEFVILVLVDVISVVGIAVLAWLLLRERARRRRRAPAGAAPPHPRGSAS